MTESKNCLLLLMFVFLGHQTFSQVVLRDTVVAWQHHRFELNEDYSIKSFSTDDDDIQEVTFNGKVIENELIRLVLLPEYGGRVLSFVYKPTGHEYLYQSECGSAYGIGEGNFYYNWLMVYGGIFPTFPEPEHGKTWLIPWDYSVINESNDVITVRMQYKDSTAYDGAPGKFNNGITNSTCQVDISVHKGSALWDFDVTLINNESSPVNYEYWTCTTLAPGSNSGETGTPLESEMLIPVEEYFPGWSPGNWIGNYNNYYDFDRINFLSKWEDMGIAYAHGLDKIYWGVINHLNDEGIFRLSDNVETYGVKLWTWGKDNVDNNMFDYSNGGADNYIELWAGVSSEFFEDATLGANEVKHWKESYYATTGLTSISNMNEWAAINHTWDEESMEMAIQINTFRLDEEYDLRVLVDGEINPGIPDISFPFSQLGFNHAVQFKDLGLSTGFHDISIQIRDLAGDVLLESHEEVEVVPVLAISSHSLEGFDFFLESIDDRTLRITLESNFDAEVVVYSLEGKVLYSNKIRSNSNLLIDKPTRDLILIKVYNNSTMKSKKFLLN